MTQRRRLEMQEVKRRLGELHIELRRIVEWFTLINTGPTPNNLTAKQVAALERRAEQGHALSAKKLELYHRYNELLAEHEALEASLREEC
jgi:hypothetical protein